MLSYTIIDLESIVYPARKRGVTLGMHVNKIVQYAFPSTGQTTPLPARIQQDQQESEQAAADLVGEIAPAAEIEIEHGEQSL